MSNASEERSALNGITNAFVSSSSLRAEEMWPDLAETVTIRSRSPKQRQPASPASKQKGSPRPKTKRKSPNKVRFARETDRDTASLMELTTKTAGKDMARMTTQLVKNDAKDSAINGLRKAWNDSDSHLGVRGPMQTPRRAPNAYKHTPSRATMQGGVKRNLERLAGHLAVDDGAQMETETTPESTTAPHPPATAVNGASRLDHAPRLPVPTAVPAGQSPSPPHRRTSADDAGLARSTEGEESPRTTPRRAESAPSFLSVSFTDRGTAVTVMPTLVEAASPAPAAPLNADAVDAGLDAAMLSRTPPPEHPSPPPPQQQQQQQHTAPPKATSHPRGPRSAPAVRPASPLKKSETAWGSSRGGGGGGGGGGRTVTTPGKRPPPRVLASPLIKAQTAPARAPPPRHLSAGGSGGGVGVLYTYSDSDSTVQRGADRSGVRSGTPRKPVFATPPTSPEAAADVTSGQRGEAPASPSVLTRAAQIVVFLLWLLLLGPLIVCSWMGLGRFVGDVAVDEDGLDDKDQLDKSFHKVLESALHTPRKPSVKQREGWAAAGWTRGVVKAKAPRTPGRRSVRFSETLTTQE
eukprot:m.208962 g.208962  ORF g.208962 m.208962 type:complete len:579 (+) comp15462_c0_seq1:97-1833(+)